MTSISGKPKASASLELREIVGVQRERIAWQRGAQFLHLGFGTGEKSQLQRALWNLRGRGIP
jgi:hypothetical protein